MGFSENMISERSRGGQAKQRLQQSILQLNQLKQQDAERQRQIAQEEEDRRIQQATRRFQGLKTLWSDPTWHRQMQGQTVEKNKIGDELDYWAKEAGLPPQPRTNPLESLMPDVMLKVHELNKDPELAWMAEPYARNQIGDLLDTFSRDYWTGQDETQAQAKQAALSAPPVTGKQKESVPPQPTPTPVAAAAVPMPWDVPDLSVSSTPPERGVPSASEPSPPDVSPSTVPAAAVPTYERTPTGMFAKWRAQSGLREEDVGANFKDPVTAMLTLSVWAADPALQSKLRRVGKSFIPGDPEQGISADEAEETAWKSGPDNYARIAGDAVADYIERSKLTAKAKDWVASLSKLRSYLPAQLTKETADQTAATLASSNPDFIGFRDNPAALSFFIQNMGGMTQQQARQLEQSQEHLKLNWAQYKATQEWRDVQKTDMAIGRKMQAQRLSLDKTKWNNLSADQRESLAQSLEVRADARVQAAQATQIMNVDTTDKDGNIIKQPQRINKYTDETIAGLNQQAADLQAQADALRSGGGQPPTGDGLSPGAIQHLKKNILKGRRPPNIETLQAALRNAGLRYDVQAAWNAIQDMK